MHVNKYYERDRYPFTVHPVQALGCPAMDDEPTPPPARRSAWQIFAGWHREPSLWRDVYVRALSALIVAAVIYSVAVMNRLVSAKPLVYLFFVFALTGLVWNAYVIVQTRKSGTVTRRQRLVYSVNLVFGVGLCLLTYFLGPDWSLPKH